MSFFAGRGPSLPRMIAESVLAIRREKFYQLNALLQGKAGADADVLQSSRTVEQAE
jgi:hypothetical protein